MCQVRGWHVFLMCQVRWWHVFFLLLRQSLPKPPILSNRWVAPFFFTSCQVSGWHVILKLAWISRQQVVTRSVVLSESLHVAEKYGNRLQRLNIIKSLLAPFPCVLFDEVDATYYATIQRDLEPQGQVIGRYDQ